jgi:DNA-binding transcriptional ArsR family regulator
MELKTALSTLAALGHGSRLHAFRHLVQAGPHGMPVGELRDHLDIPAPTLTAHLNVLRRAGLVANRREGRVIRVRANYERMDALIAYLTENCCARPGACAPVSVCKPTKLGASK